MAVQRNNNDKLLWMLGLAITLPMILLSGPLAGYLIGHTLLVKRFGMPAFLTPALMMVGLIGSGLQAVQLIRKLKQNQKS